jgi:hypothetical protein
MACDSVPTRRENTGFDTCIRRRGSETNCGEIDTGGPTIKNRPRPCIRASPIAASSIYFMIKKESIIRTSLPPFRALYHDGRPRFSVPPIRTRCPAHTSYFSRSRPAASCLQAISIDAMTGFCQNGLWPAVQSFVVFLVTNIFAHAASINLPAGADARTITLSVLCAVIAPISLRSNAFRVMRRCRRRLSFRLKTTKGGEGQDQSGL